jgi:hypothetical protein
MDQDTRNVEDLYTVEDAIWSPDGKALLLKVFVWEAWDVRWLYPIAPGIDEANLRDPEGMGWGSGKWTRDGRSILLSGTSSMDRCDLVRVNRDTLVHETLIVGMSENLCVEQAQELPSGIVFLAQCWSCEPRGTRLFSVHQTEEGVSYEPVTPAGDLCYSTDAKWDETGNVAALPCGRAMQFVSIDGEAMRVDLTPFLDSLAGLDFARVHVDWGAADE